MRLWNGKGTGLIVNLNLNIASPEEASLQLRVQEASLHCPREGKETIASMNGGC